MKFRKKPVVIDAFQTASDQPLETPESMAREIPQWFLDAQKQGKIYANGPDIFIRTEEGEMKANPGDYVIRGVKGEFYACKPDIFEMNYEPVVEESSEPV